ncbi:hypothetical protein EX30DRAFT_342719 [Ascodesmis nigricans]|uniref:Uncharacterized protein n=1 Tax=Ascodesmis nigricans TaxID=341454 RepID=A0A4V3SI79_9PEZI|nr:hypothetical protein EX30DRAFT_342719 [Ascodesmis nigricans]
MKRKHLDALRSTEREGYVAQKASWEVLKGLKSPEQDEQGKNDAGEAQGKRRKENEYQVEGVGEYQGEGVQVGAQQAEN